MGQEKGDIPVVLGPLRNGEISEFYAADYLFMYLCIYLYRENKERRKTERDSNR